MENNKILEHQMKRFGVVTVMDVLLKDPQTGEVITIMDTLKVTSLNQEGQNKSITGGINNPKLIEYNFGRTVTMEIQDALMSFQSMKTLMGAKELSKFVYTFEMEGFIEEEKAKQVVKLPTGVVPITSELVNAVVIDLDNNKQYAVDAASGQNLELAGATGAVGARVKVYVTAEKPTKGSAVTIDSLSLPPTVSLVGKTFFINQKTGKQENYELEIPLLKIAIGGNFTMDAEGDASVFDFTAEALAHPTTKQFFVWKYLGEE